MILRILSYVDESKSSVRGKWRRGRRREHIFVFWCHTESQDFSVTKIRLLRAAGTFFFFWRSEPLTDLNHARCDPPTLWDTSLWRSEISEQLWDPGTTLELKPPCDPWVGHHGAVRVNVSIRYRLLSLPKGGLAHSLAAEYNPHPPTHQPPPPGCEQ